MTDEARLPNLVLAGTGKAGTSSLFWYLSQHPEICASRVKETKYFLAASQIEEPAQGRLPSLEGYLAHFRHCGRETYVMEATPQYFPGGERLVHAIATTLPDPRIVITLRDPVQRVWSVYRFVKSMLLLPKDESFRDFADGCISLFRERFDDFAERCTALYLQPPHEREGGPYWAVCEAMYARFLPAWLDAFDDTRLKVVFFDGLVADAPGLVETLFEWLAIDASGVASLDLSWENRSVPYRSRILQQIALVANKERLLGSRRSLKEPLRRVYQAINADRTPERMPERTKAQLHEVFRQPNIQLLALLKERGYTDLPSWLARQE